MATDTVTSPTPTTAEPDIRPGDKLSFLTKFAYGGGDFASQLMWSLAGSFLIVFYTDKVGLAAGTVSLIMLGARIFDALNDPLMGALQERTRSRWGRFRPYIIWGTPVLAVFCVLTFTAPDFSSMAARVAWAAVTYVGLGVAYTVVNLSYGALSTVMSRKSDQRLALTSYRMIGTNLGAVLLSAISMPLIIRFSGVGDGQSTTVFGYTMVALIMAVIAVPLFYLVAATCKEVITPVNEDKVPLRQTLKVVLTNKYILLVFSGFLFIMTGFFGRLGIAIYYFIYCLHRPDLIAPLMMLPSLAGAIGIALFARLANRIGKKNTVVIANLWCGASLIALYFVPFENIPMVFVLTAVFGLGNFAGPIIMSMVPDAIDYAEDRTGVRADGTSYSFVSLATKFGSAFGGAIGIAIIGWYGYVPEQQQSAQVMDGINLVTNVGTGLCFLLGIIPFLFYDLTEKKFEEIRSRLDAKAASTTH